MKELRLNEGWRLNEAPLCWDRSALARVLALEEGWMDCALPCDVHVPLQRAGRIRDVVKADYCFEAEWIEKRSWWFVREFDVDEADLRADAAELTIESIDARGDVFLNGEWLGAHFNAHYPFAYEVGKKLRPGKNVLAVRATCGLEAVRDEDLAQINWAVCTEAENRGDLRRAFVRKPQYTVGWDWGPKALTCGLVKGAYLRFYNAFCVRGAHVTTLRAREGAATLKLEVEIEQLDPIATREADLRVAIALDGEERRFAREGVLLTSGLNYVDLQIDLPGAKLWWPNGCGAQPLYEARIQIEAEGVACAYPPFQFGVRTVELDTAKAADGSRNFALRINGEAIFCKGGDWIPADSIYARVTAEKYQALVSEAKAANFNMLRVWGGGIYERDEFYDACDRAGILLWHDFMFSCSAYPDHLPWFQRECERELDYQTRRLRNRACLALFCGNNEDHWIFNAVDNPHWGLEIDRERQYGLYASNVLAPRALRANCPEIPYWNSSPYGGPLPNDDFCGDVHHWNACMMNPEMAKRIEPRQYDLVRARFVTEYGYPGPCPRASIEEYLDGQPIDRQSAVWDLHNNTFEKQTVAAGIEKHYLDGAADLDLDDYILYAGMVQSLMLEYSLEAIRFKDFCAGALFWMYNDTWGEVGWTIVDYYLRRKISYYGVQRAFAPVKLTLREADGRARLQAANDTGAEIALPVRVGYLPFDGAPAELARQTLILRPHSRAYLADYALPEADYARGVFCVLPDAPDVAPAALRLRDTRQLIFGGGEARVVETRREGQDLVVTLTADRYVHGVYAEGVARMSDNYFDLLPGQVKRVTLYGVHECPRWRCVR